jgi:hypothetical protein
LSYPHSQDGRLRKFAAPPRRLLLGLLDPHANDLAVEPSPVFGVVEQAVSLRERICACLGSAGQHWPALDGGPSSSAAAADIDSSDSLLSERMLKYETGCFRRVHGSRCSWFCS